MTNHLRRNRLWTALCLPALVACAADVAGGEDPDPPPGEGDPMPGGAVDPRTGRPLPPAAPPPGAPGSPAPSTPPPAGSPAPGATGAVVINELMYHAVLEEADEEQHEFIELYNRSRAALDLGGWSLAGDVSFTFPKPTPVGPGAYVVVAKSRRALAALEPYGLTEAQLLGDYKGEIQNGGGTVSLIDPQGAVQDVVRFRDEAPWPVGADALGAGEAWLPRALQPLAKHKHLGRSLERLSPDVASSEVANWEASAVDGATPGKRNSVAGLLGDGGAVRPVVAQIAAGPAGESRALRPDEPVVVRARFAPSAPKAPEVEFFVDDVARADEPRTRAPLAPAPDGSFEARLPGQKANAILRYRVLADRGRGSEVVSPRPTDPYEWHGLFVAPEIATRSPVVHMFVAPADWTRLWTNVTGGPNSGCTVSPTWGNDVPAVLGVDGRVYDVRVRYQGSRWNRTTGHVIPTWNFPKPTAPSPLLALSWSIDFPKFARLGGRRQLTLNKLYQGCPGTNSYVQAKLLEAAGVPSQKVRFVRFYINGGYYHYMMDLEPFKEEMMKRFTAPGEPVGDLFKADGAGDDQGPWGAANFRPLKTWCGFSSDLRYATTYKRVTYDWRGPALVRKLIEELDAAYAIADPTQRLEAQRQFFARNFDVAEVASDIAVRNWSAVGDDAFHNFFLYRRASDQKWILIPNDFDLDFGLGTGTPWTWGANAPTTTLTIGMEGDAGNRLGWNRLKDAFLRSHRAEFERRLRELNRTVLAPENIAKLVDEAQAAFSIEDWNASPINKPAWCDIAAKTASIKTWARARSDVVVQRLGP